MTLTGARSLAFTFGPDGGVPVAVATLSNAACTFGREQEYYPRPRHHCQDRAQGCVGNERGFEGAKTGTCIDCQVVAGSESQTFRVTMTTVDGSRFNHNY